jgi:transcriptional regulator GlxA family with amidase domain
MAAVDVGILIFDDVEVLDFAGPFEVFSVAGRRAGLEPFHVYTMAADATPVLARNALSINPHYTLRDAPAPEILVVPGGQGTRALLRDDALLGWLRTAHRQADTTLSVCTGALVLGAAGLLDGLRATTHHLALDELREVAPGAVVVEDERVVDNGRVVLSAGVAAGIEASLHLVGRILGREHAEEAARYMEYPWPRD